MNHSLHNKFKMKSKNIMLNVHHSMLTNQVLLFFNVKVINDSQESSFNF
jgi:hypothetical protein